MLRTVAIALACSLIALAGGLWLGGHPEHLSKRINDIFVSDDRATEAELVGMIKDNYYKPVNEEKLRQASLKGIVRSLGDRFSHYLTPKEAAQLKESISGAFEGVGMTVEQDKRGLRVLNVFGGSPAKQAGLHPGDVIVSVNGRTIKGVSSAVATGKIKGPAGTKVRLSVVAPGKKQARSIVATRKRIQVPVARGRVVERGGAKYGVVQLASFSSGAHGLLRREIEKVRRKGAKGVVLDLRGNGGGLLTEAILTASIFIEDGRIVSVRGLHRPESRYSAQGKALAPKLPVVVLVDGGSASASEIVTGALRDRHRATVVGTNTFGKGLVQEPEPLSNGGELDLTIANYYLPGGRTITTKGITPQVRARDNPRTRRDEALPTALKTLAAKSR